MAFTVAWRASAISGAVLLNPALDEGDTVRPLRNGGALRTACNALVSDVLLQKTKPVALHCREVSTYLGMHHGLRNVRWRLDCQTGFFRPFCHHALDRILGADKGL